ncbi:MAG: UvrD-helicase domain-containing protein [Candidatus Eisenbacteria bacterium]
MSEKKRDWLEGLTDPQIEAASAKDENLWVTAGAGTGKTKVLTARYLHLHLARKAPIRKLLAITFTEKAAGEMRERIAGQLQELRDADAPDAPNPRESLREIPHAPIHTIDSLCYRLVREHGESAGLEPAVEVLDPVEAEEWQEKIWVRVLDRWWETRREESLRLFRALSWKVGAAHAGGIDPWPLFALLRAIRTAGRRLEEVPFVPDLEEERRAIVLSLEELFPKLEEIHASTKAAATKEKLAALLALRGVAPEARTEAFARARTAVNRSVTREAKESVSAAIDLLEGWARVEEEERLAGPRRLLGELAADLQKTFSEEKARAGVMDFLDLEEGALRILENESVAREIRSRYAYLLLDECQDTNELQLRIVRRLLSRGRLLAVGDAKQSIYAFRDADVTAFLAMSEELGDSAHRVELDWNFRSRPEILGWVNFLFPKLWGANAAMSVPYAPLEASEKKKREFSPKEAPSVEILFVRGSETKEVREREAGLLADRLRAIHGERLDDLTYKDMVLLFRSTSDLQLYERALRARGIPTAVATGRGFFQTREVTDLLSGLSLVDDPYDDLALAGALRSPLAGLSDEDLALLLIGRKEGDPPLWDEARRGERLASISAEGWERLARFTSLFEELRALRGRVPPFRLLERLVGETRYVEAHLLLPDGLRFRANIRKLLELARALDDREELSLPETIRTLERYRYTRLREPESALDVEREAVRLFTIHGAKGMEFPLVAVVDLGRKPRADHPSLLYQKEIGVGVRAREAREGKGARPFLYEKIERRAAGLAEAEETRLLYVALTRAQRHLLLSGCRTERAEGWLARIEQAISIPEEPGVHVIGDVRVRVLGHVRATPEGGRPLLPFEVARGPARHARGADPGEVERVARRILAPPPAAGLDEDGRTVTGVHAFASCPRRFRLSRRFPLPRLRREGGEGAAGIGTAFHRIMEAHWRGRGAGDPANEAPAELREWRGRLLSLPEIAGLAAEPPPEGEVSFSAPVGGRPLRGVLDLLAATGCGYLIVDYKTDRAAPAEILDRYRISLSLYKAAVRAIVGEARPVEAAIYAARSGALLPVEDGEVEAVETLGRYDRAEERGEFPATENETCPFCAYRRGCPAFATQGKNGDTYPLPDRLT